MISEETIEDIDRRYWTYHQVRGILFTRRGSFTGPNKTYGPYGTGADNALFTGFALAAFSYRYGVTNDLQDFYKIQKTVDGISTLTNVTGIPGVLVKLAFPLDDKTFGLIGYDKNNNDKDNTWTRRRLEGQLYESGTHFYYTNTTRDQLTGIVFGLTVAWDVLNGVQGHSGIKEQIKGIVKALVFRLTQTGWSLEDHQGKRGTNAFRPDAQLKHALLLLNFKCGNQTAPTGLKWFNKFLWLATFYYVFPVPHYVWNLRTAVALSLGNQKWLTRISKFTDSPFTKYATRTSTDSDLTLAQIKIMELIRHPHDGFFAWQKKNPKLAINEMGPAIDVLLPYWMRKYYEQK